MVKTIKHSKLSLGNLKEIAARQVKEQTFYVKEDIPVFNYETKLKFDKPSIKLNCHKEYYKKDELSISSFKHLSRSSILHMKHNISCPMVYIGSNVLKKYSYKDTTNKPIQKFNPIIEHDNNKYEYEKHGNTIRLKKMG